MSTLNSFLTTKVQRSRLNFWLVSLALGVGLILSVLSWLELCVEHCSANQDYRLFGLPFAIVGMTFFAVLVSAHVLSVRYHFLTRLVGWMIASALGAEIMFIIVQKYQIGHWCPVCLSIAASIATASIVLVTGYLKNFKIILQHQNRGDIMKKVKQCLTTCSFLLFGFLLSFIGISKVSAAEAAVNDIKNRIVFGTEKSPVEVYFVTDWFCPSCKKVEPQIEKIYPKIKSKVAFYFIDYPIHRKSLNFTPYNLAFLVNDKSHYFKARDMLNEISEENESPNEEDIIEAAKDQGIKFKSLSFSDIKAGIDFFDEVIDKYDIRATPTIIITNQKKNKVIKLEGRDQISESKILDAIEKVKSS